MSRRNLSAFVGMLVITLLLPPAAAAQSASGGGIAGEVKDATGAILPGVTVEAASPALIEKVRAAVTDGRGQFNIIDLRPGTYTVTFTLPAFTTVRREGVELTAGFTAVINATLRVGGVEETVTVSGASPIVDTVNVRTQNVLSHEVLEALPTAKGVPGLSALTLGTVGAIQDVGGNRAESPASFSFHGSRNTDQRIKYDGMSMNSFHTTGGGPNRLMLLNQVAIQEMVLETSGISAESETGGVQMNAVPREGGNRFRVSLLGNFANDALQSTNVTSELTALGLTTPPSVKKIYDLGLGVGGPIRRDKLWFYSANRRWGAEESLANAYWNATPSTPFYVPDLSRPVFAANNLEDYGVRLTWQAAAKHKLTFSENAQRSCVCPSAPTANRTPDASDDFRYGGSDGTNNGFHHLVQTSWSYPATNRLLFDAGASFGYFLQSNVPVDGAYDRIGITDSAQNISYSSLNGSLFGASYSILSNGEQVSNASHNLNQRMSMSYVTGSHAFKTGLVTTFGIHDVYRSLNRYAIQYTFQNKVPNSLTEWTSPTVLRSRVFGAGLYAQDQWKAVQKLTVNLGVRFDTFNARTLEEHLPAARFVGARDYAAVENVPNWRDITPRVGIAYDLFGDGKTAVKASLGRYVIGLGIAISEANHPAQQEVASTSRTWNDSFFAVGDPRRGNYVPDCDLLSPVGNDECGAMSATTFGTTVVTNRYDPEVLNGFGQRDYNWQGAVSLQHELRDGIGLNASYFYRTFGNFRITDNLAVTPQDFSPYCITLPNDPRLPGAGQPLCGLYDINPSVFGLQNNLVTSVEPYGKQTEVYNGVEFSVSARFGRGGRLAGGISTGRTEFNQCPVVDSPQQTLFCNYELPWQGQTQVKLNGSYPLPWKIQLSAVFQNLAGIPVTASYSATNAEIFPTLGRNLGQCRASATCNGTVVINNLYEPNTEFADRLTQVDVRATKIFTFGNANVQAMFDVYNLFNANTVLALNNRYSSTGVNLWQQPTSILAGRLFKFGAQLDF